MVDWSPLWTINSLPLACSRNVVIPQHKNSKTIQCASTDPVVLERAIADREALDHKNNTLHAGDLVYCVDASLGGDFDPSDEIELGKTYVVESLHDEDGLILPMITLKGCSAGAVFPERFIQLMPIVTKYHPNISN